MRTSALLASILAAGAFASPLRRDLEEREYVYDVTVITKYVTVTAGAAPTKAAAAANDNHPKYSNFWGNQQKSKTIKCSSKSSTSTVVIVKPSSTEAPVVQETTPEPTTEPATTYAPATTAEPTQTYASSATSAATSAAASGGPGQDEGSLYAEKVIWHHNQHRANHSAPDCSWNQTLHDIAMEHAKTCIYEHNTEIGGGGYGQNIAAGTPPENVSAIITGAFYNGEAPNFTPFYGEATPSDMSEATFDGFGHFTQLVWKDSLTVACATYDCSGAGNGPRGLGNVNEYVEPYFTVCNYYSAGNFLGSFDVNVLRPLGHPTIEWDSYP